MNIGERIKLKRKESNLTLEELGERTGLTRFLIHKYEKGIITNIPSDKIEKIAEALNTSPAFLMGWEEKKENKEDEISFDDFRFALYGEVKDLTEEQKQDVLDFARFIKNKNK